MFLSSPAFSPSNSLPVTVPRLFLWPVVSVHSQTFPSFPVWQLCSIRIRKERGGWRTPPLHEKYVVCFRVSLRNKKVHKPSVAVTTVTSWTTTAHNTRIQPRKQEQLTFWLNCVYLYCLAVFYLVILFLACLCVSFTWDSISLVFCLSNFLMLWKCMYVGMSVNI